MKFFTLLLKKYAILVGILFTSFFCNAQINIANYTFNNGNDGWIDGGTYANRTTSNGYRCSDVGSIFVRYSYNLDNSSRFTSPDLDLTAYTEVDFTFCFTSLSIDNNEGFDLQYFDGFTWITLESYRRGNQFTNSSSISQTFTFALDNVTYNFDANSAFRFIGQCSDTNEYAVFDDINIDGYFNGPEINIQGNGITITDGDTTPEFSDNTDFGSIGVASGTNTNTFTIKNTGNENLVLTNTSPYIEISGANSADFTITSIPSTPISPNNTTTFAIAFNPSANGLRTAIVSIPNNDFNENPYNFNISGNGSTLGNCSTTISSFPHIEGFESVVSSWSQDLNIVDDLDWSRRSTPTPTNVTGPSQAKQGDFYYYVEASGSNNNKTANLVSPCYDLVGTSNPRFTFSHHMYGADMGTLNLQLSLDNGSNYDITLWSQTGQIQNSTISAWIPISIDLKNYIGNKIRLRFQATTGNSFASDMSIDNLILSDKPTPVIAPGGVIADLSTWLKGTDGLSYNDGDPVSLWQDQGIASNATINKAGQEPTYYDNINNNINFNPVVDFDNDYTTVTLDSDYSSSNTNTQFLEGEYGYYSQEIFLVIIPDIEVTSTFGSMDVFCADENLGGNETDATGIGFGNYTSRFNNEIISYAHGTTSSGNGYGLAQSGTGDTYKNAGIINVRNNSTASRQELFYNANNIENLQNDIPDFANVNDSRYWIGRSEGWEASTDGRIAEIITYSSRKEDVNLTQERNRIQSYLAIKYGITLGENGTSQDYVDSDGSIIWDQSEDVNYNYDITGIGRDDASGLNQKQSRSINNEVDGIGRTQGIVTMGLSTILDTNTLNQGTNPTTFNDKNFLVWGNNGADLNLAATTISVDMSAGITPALTTDVSFTAMQRVWKVVETGGDVASVKISIPENAIRNIIPPGNFYMFISNTGVFDPTADYRIMTPDGNGNIETNYDFDDTKYITFGYAPRIEVVRSIYFDGLVDYVDMEDVLDLDPTGFTVSAWIKRDASDSGTKSILSKRNPLFTIGYDFRILNDNRIQMHWKNGSNQVLTSIVSIPDDEWHHVAAIYNGARLFLYIDGVIARQANRSAPLVTDESFYIGAAGKNNPTQHFRGNIDEVRIWDTQLSEDQLRFIMNQEIEENTSFVSGKVLPTTITKNEVGSIPWSQLAGYYPMSTYTYTNTEDASGNGHQGALRNLNTVDRQTAPLPYQSQSNGDWTTDGTWLNNTVQPLPNDLSLVDNSTPIDWNIVNINNNVKINQESILGRERQVLGLYVNAGSELTVDGDNADATAGNGITISHYLKLDGKIDLEGQSQLVQVLDSDLDPTSSGILEKDQQGAADVFTYNYWSSPVGETNTTSNNNSYSVTDVMYDGINPINFSNSGYDGANGTIITIADYWIWKFANQPDDNYSAWQHVRRNGTLFAGEGFTMKGPGSGSIVDQQNYVFLGKPNNGDINLTLNAGNDYLVGNPYPSAINANTFITDNGPNITGAGANPLISGTLYFWEHWGGGSHILNEYQGGYATYNFSGGVAAPSLGTNDPDVGTGGTPTKVPGLYIPVSQGFFVVGENTGSINFNNGQRDYKKEKTSGSDNSIFIKSSNGNTKAFYDEEAPEERMKFRIGFNSINTIHRQLLLTIDEATTTGYDWAYDAKIYDDLMDDIYWIIEDEKYTIQGSNEAGVESVYPLGVKTEDDGLNSITIDSLENVPENIDLFIHDVENDTYHNLRENDFEFFLPAGKHLNRFELTFRDFNADILSIDDTELNTLDVFYNIESKSIALYNPSFLEIKSIELYNLLGQQITIIEDISELDYSEYKVKNLSTGTYILKINTLSGLLSKKVLVK